MKSIRSVAVAVAPPLSNSGQHSTLNDRLLVFLKTQPGAEYIDDLALTSVQRSAKKADFFLKNRTVVCEVKSLQSDTKEKLGKLIQPILAKENAPVFYGEWPLEKILKHFPNGTEIKKELFNSATSAVEDGFRDANRQIRTTKEMFGLTQAGGALVITNDLVEVLSPEILAHKIGELFRKRTPTGQLRFPEIEAVWILSETHFLEISLGVKAMPAILLTRNEASGAGQILDELQPKWAETNGMPMVKMNPELAGTVKFEKFAPEGVDERKITNQECWEREYRQQPYLRRHTEQELQHYFELVMSGLAVGFLVGASVEERELGRKLVIRWTHLLQELKERGTDMRAFSPGMQSLGATIRAGGRPHPSLAEIEAAATKPSTMEKDKYYTIASEKNYRCVSVSTGFARLVLFNMIMGQTVEALVVVDEPKWKYYWPLLDQPLVSALEERYRLLVSRHPELFA